jgi:hypothetical protein
MILPIANPSAIELVRSFCILHDTDSPEATRTAGASRADGSAELA